MYSFLYTVHVRRSVLQSFLRILDFNKENIWQLLEIKGTVSYKWWPIDVA